MDYFQKPFSPYFFDLKRHYSDDAGSCLESTQTARFLSKAHANTPRIRLVTQLCSFKISSLTAYSLLSGALTAICHPVAHKASP